MFGLRKKEQRERTATQSSPELVEVLGLQDYMKMGAGIHVTTDAALGVPAFWAAVNFLSGTIAGLPLHVYNKTKDGRIRAKGPIANILHGAVNDETSSFDWRKYSFDRTFTSGRQFTFIERNSAGRVMNLWPLEPLNMTVKKTGGKRVYLYKDGDKTKRYDASEIIDIPFMLRPDGVSHYSPIATNKEVIGASIAATRYGSKFMQAGGVPPFAITGNFQSGGAMRRAGDDMAEAVEKASREERLALILPQGLDIKAIGSDPEKTQLVEAQRFSVEQIARIFSLPPTFLQDLTHGTFSNTEQQDLHFVKHTLKRWIEQAEQEMNLKLFGRSGRQYVEFNVDGLLRGDFKTRMEGHSTAVQNGLETPNEARELENRPPLAGGDSLMIQGATVPIENQFKQSEGDDDGA